MSVASQQVQAVHPSNASAEMEAQEPLRRNWGWFLVFGIALVVLGSIAVARPAAATVAVEMTIGWVLLLSGIVLAITAFVAKDLGGFFLQMAIAVLYGLTGFALMVFPLRGAVTLTFLLAVFFLAQGIARVVFAAQNRDAPAWGWQLFSGIAGILLAVLIFHAWPVDSLWAIGLLVGVNILMAGMTTIMTSMIGATAD